MITSPGIYTDITNEEYHASHGISSSGISLIIPPNCPALYHYHYILNRERKPSAAHVTGSVLHCMVLEPHDFDKRYAVLNESPPARRGEKGKQAYDEFMKPFDGKQVIGKSDYDVCADMATSVMKHGFFNELFSNGQVENSLAWIDEDSGALLRSRPDFYSNECIIDLKTTKDLSDRSFRRSIVEYGYHRQAAMACDGLEVLTGRKYRNYILFVVCKEPPYLVRAFVLSDDSIQAGRDQYKWGASIYANCLEDNHWPGYKEVIEEIGIMDYLV